jgi:hypothetical protein
METTNNTNNRWLLDCNVAIAIGIDLHEKNVAARARQNHCTLATFDKGLASQHPDVAYLIP